MKYFCIVFAMTLCVACTRAPVKKRADALKKSSRDLSLTDDLSLPSLAEAIRREAAVWKAKPVETGKAVFGQKIISSKTYAAALEYAAQAAETSADKESFLAVIKRDFDFYEAYGLNDWSKVLLTSYFEPELKGSLKKSDVFSQPLYKTPSDLVEVAFSRSDERFADLGQLRGRLAKDKTARGTAQLLPYFTRDEIDNKSALKNRGLELCYLDPVDAFFLQIQGSGTIVLQDGSLFRVGYSDQNGQPYQALGRFLLDVIPLEKMSMQSIVAYLRTLPVDKMKTLLAKNPSYAFFQKREGPALTSNGTPAVAGRTIATDGRYFPKGTLAFLKFEKPIFATPEDSEPKKFESTARLVLDQDSGGAITGGGRVDLFWGTGAEAQQSAGVMKQTAELFYLVPKDTLLEKL